MDAATRKKLLQAATTKLKKQFGDDVIVDTEKAKEYETISTGSLLIDTATGIGGLPLGRLVEVAGPSGSGKSTFCSTTVSEAQKKYPEKMVLYADLEHACITGDSLIYLPDLNTNKKIEDLVGQDPFNVLSVTQDKVLVNRKAIAVSKGYKPVYQLTASRGFSIRATEDHRVLTKEGYKELKDITTDDIIYTPKTNTNYTEEESFSISLEEQAKYRLLGLWIGAGTYKQPTISCADSLIEQDLQEIAKIFNCRLRKDKYSLWFTSLEEDRSSDVDPKLLTELFLNQKRTLSECAFYFNSCSETIKKLLFKYSIVDKDYDFRLHSVSKRIQGTSFYESSEITLKPFKNPVLSFLQQFSCFDKYSKEQHIPEGLSRDQLRQVLAGIYLADGCTIGPDNQRKAQAFYSTSSKNLAIDLQSSLLSFGILSYISKALKKKEDGSYYDPCYSVTIRSSNNLKKFLKYIPIYGYKKERVEKAVSSITDNSKLKIDNDLIELKIKSIEYSGVEKVYDISLIDSSLNNFERNFVANNIIIHNCDLTYMQSLGVDTSEDKFLLVQPTTIEEAFEIIDAYMATGLFSVVIIDSIGNSITKQILEKGYTESTVGSLARACATGLTKLVPLVKDSNTLLILVNTEYSKISFMGGNDTKGGNSVKYLTSIRIRLSKRDLINSDDNKEVIAGQVLTFKFVKNKCGQPFKSGETTLYFYKGFDKHAEIVDIAIDKGFVERGGAWYNFEVPEKKGSKKMVPMKFQGKDRVIDFFKNDDDSFKYLETKVLAADVLKEISPNERET